MHPPYTFDPACVCLGVEQLRASLDPRTMYRAGDLEFHVASLAVDLEDPTVLLVCVLRCVGHVICVCVFFC